MKTYRLGSSPAFYAPGVVRWAINGAAFEEDRAAMVRVIAEGWNVPEDAALALVTKAAAFTVDDETVIFSA